MDEKTKILIEKFNVCTCECHVIGKQVLHCIPCCELCYEKYIKSGGNIDIEKWTESIENVKQGK